VHPSRNCTVLPLLSIFLVSFSLLHSSSLLDHCPNPQADYERIQDHSALTATHPTSLSPILFLDNDSQLLLRHRDTSISSVYSLLAQLHLFVYKPPSLVEAGQSLHPSRIWFVSRFPFLSLVCISFRPLQSALVFAWNCCPRRVSPSSLAISLSPYFSPSFLGRPSQSRSLYLSYRGKASDYRIG
jgi:hypothetical protein